MSHCHARRSLCLITAAIGGGLSYGFSQAGTLKNLNNATYGTLQAVTANVLNQGAMILVGQQDHFNWKSVGMAAVTAPMNNYFDNKVGNSNIGYRLLNQTAQSLVSQKAQQLFYGGRFDWKQVTTDAFGNTLGNKFVDDVVNPYLEEKKLQREKREQDEINRSAAKERVRQDVGLNEMTRDPVTGKYRYPDGREMPAMFVDSGQIMTDAPQGASRLTISNVAGDFEEEIAAKGNAEQALLHNAEQVLLHNPDINEDLIRRAAERMQMTHFNSSGSMDYHPNIPDYLIDHIFGGNSEDIYNSRFLNFNTQLEPGLIRTSSPLDGLAVGAVSLRRKVLGSFGGSVVANNLVRETVLANIAESRAVREASNFGTSRVAELERVQTATDFYRAQGFTGARLDSHLAGIDFSQPVDVIRLSQGERLSQFATSSDRIGNYFAGANANRFRLGVYDPTARIKLNFSVEQPTFVLRSTTADFNYASKNYFSRGGETQYFAGPDYLKNFRLNR